MSKKQTLAKIPTSGSHCPVCALIPEEIGPKFKTGKMDLKGPWHWGNLDSFHIQDLLERILLSQELSWKTLREARSHLIDVTNIIPKAQKRLRELGLEEIEQLYSLRVSGRIRIYGIKEVNILWLLWWDPLHEIYPSLK